MNWIEKDDALRADVEFQDFISCWGYMTMAAIVIEKHNHHPEWSNVYNKLSIKLTTHDAGNKVTVKDRALAKELLRLYHSIAS